MANFRYYGAMNVSLTPELEAFIDARVRSGFYHSASEVIREALRLLAEQDALKQKRLDRLTAEIDEGLADLRAGRSHLLQSVRDEIKARRESR
jgi:antitoxin ParD1/3/4